MGLPRYEWKVNCTVKSCCRPDEDHTEEEKRCPQMGVWPTVTAAVCLSESDGRGGRPEAGPLFTLTA